MINRGSEETIPVLKDRTNNVSTNVNLNINSNAKLVSNKQELFKPNNEP